MARSEQYDTTEWRCAVDLAELRQSKRTSGSIIWSSMAHPDYAMVAWTLAEDCLLLSFNHGRIERFGLRSTDTAFGGTRPWLCCPACDRNVRVVYRGRAGYRCRHCYALRYPSQRESSYHRALGMAQRLRMRLGGNPNLTEPFPDKPKWMRHTTYRRLERKDQQWSDACAVGIMSKFGL